jgi:hypothetical protein
LHAIGHGGGSDQIVPGQRNLIIRDTLRRGRIGDRL